MNSELAEIFSHKRKIEMLCRNLSNEQLAKLIDCAQRQIVLNVETDELDAKKRIARQKIASDLAQGAVSGNVKDLFVRLSKR